ncbi:hypothetical protein C0J52_10608 [Blattella germanica]|nr:hypothetical protein C0J52_10608 [Blattella germanica]
MRNIVILLLFVAVPHILAVCPGASKDTECFNDQTSCAEDSVLCEEDETITACFSCPVCHQYLEAYGNCTEFPNLQCVPGYECNKTDECTPIPGTCPEEMEKSCVSLRPECIGEQYAPRWCKGQKPTGRCFCVSKTGTRIFGENQWQKAENMTCACSRRVEALKEEQNRKDVTLHCTQEGNYEELQCDDGLCWCSDEKTGLPTSRILPESMMKMLYCYNETTVGSQYLRKCESKEIARARIEMEMEYHGTLNPYFTFLKCDNDGTYSPVQLNGNQLQCVGKDNAALGSYAAMMSDITTMNCRCARDKQTYSNIDLICQSNGNYQATQYTNDGAEYTVDEDGFNC